jgi:formyl-CoA transferase
MGVYMGDLAAACFAVPAILASVLERQRTGLGRHIDVSMLESLLYLAPHQTQDALLASIGIARPPGAAGAAGTVRVLETADGAHVLVHCPFPKFLASLREVVGAVEGGHALLEDERFATHETRLANLDAFWEIVQRAFRARTRREWLALLEPTDVPYAPVNSVAEAVETSQLHYRDAVTKVEVTGIGEVPTLATPFALSDAPPPGLRPPPLLGEHTRGILAGVLGYSEEQITALRRAGATGG